MAASILAVVALIGAGVAAPPSRASAIRRADVTPTSGMIAFRDARGIVVLDPANGRMRRLLSLPRGCTTTRVTGIPPIELSQPVWGRSGRHPRVYFWLTDWLLGRQRGCALGAPPRSLAEAALLVEANPTNGSLRLAAVAPVGVPCQPGADLAALPGLLVFTDGGCDEISVELLSLPLRRGEQPRPVSLATLPAPFCKACALNDVLLGPGPHGEVLHKEFGTQAPTPPPVLQWFDPGTGTAGLLSPTPPLNTARIIAAAASPNSRQIAFAAANAGAGVQSQPTGEWKALRLPRCHHRCAGASSVSWSPNGRRLAITANGQLLIEQPLGTRAPRLLARGGVSAASWSAPTTLVLRAAGPAATLTGALRSFSTGLARLHGARHGWRILAA